MMGPEKVDATDSLGASVARNDERNATLRERVDEAH